MIQYHFGARCVLPFIKWKICTFAGSLRIQSWCEEGTAILRKAKTGALIGIWVKAKSYCI